VTAPMSGSIWSYWLKHPARNLLLIGWFVVLWSALWGSFTWANLLGGAAVAIGAYGQWKSSTMKSHEV